VTGAAPDPADEGGEAPCLAPLFDDTAEGAVTDLGPLLGGAGDGVHWTLTEPSQLNANLVRLGPGASIGEHVNGEVDVVVVVLAGAGRVVVDGRSGTLRPDVVAHLPRGTRRRIDADDGGVGLAYLTVHVRRGPLTPGRPRPPGPEEGLSDP
jgi:quercetin dioxygenase-like cupin family protein